MSYTVDSIKTLSFRDGVRTRINMYLGSDDVEGAYQALKEIINNSTDEALAGFGKEIVVSYDISNNSISVRDYGRGVPFGIREDGENVLVSIYTKSHTGGKFGHDSYKNSSGLNGIGGSCVCLSSSEFVVCSYRDGKCATATFVRGHLDTYFETESTSKETGTYVHFIPDPEVFSNGDITYDFERIAEELKNISYLYPGVKFKATKVNGREVIENREYFAKSGISDFVKDNLTSPLHKHIMISSMDDGTDSVEIAFQWGKGKEKGYVFANGLLCPEGGKPVTGAKSAITKTFNSLSGEKFDGDLIRGGLFYVINCKVANPSFANQTKSKINNDSLRTLASAAFSDALKNMKEAYPAEFDMIVEMMRKVAKADEAATKAREAVLNHEKKENAYKRKKISSSEKFKDCEKHGQDSTLIICEGNSALSGLMPGRNVENEALYAIRGKIKNLLKHPLEECLENQEVSDIISILGCGILDKYNSKKLNYGKVAIASDADVDRLCCP